MGRRGGRRNNWAIHSDGMRGKGLTMYDGQSIPAGMAEALTQHDILPRLKSRPSAERVHISPELARYRQQQEITENRMRQQYGLNPNEFHLDASQIRGGYHQNPMAGYQEQYIMPQQQIRQQPIPQQHVNPAQRQPYMPQPRRGITPDLPEKIYPVKQNINPMRNMDFDDVFKQEYSKGQMAQQVIAQQSHNNQRYQEYDIPAINETAIENSEFDGSSLMSKLKAVQVAAKEKGINVPLREIHTRTEYTQILSEMVDFLVMTTGMKKEIYGGKPMFYWESPDGRLCGFNNVSLSDPSYMGLIRMASDDRFFEDSIASVYYGETIDQFKEDLEIAFTKVYAEFCGL